mgnify:FL=1
MRHRLLSLFPILTGVLLFSLLFPGTCLGMIDEEVDFSSKIGLIDLSRIKAEAPKYIRLREEFGIYDHELEKYTAEILSEHRNKVKELMKEDQAGKDDYQGQGDYFFRAQELAAETQIKIDSKKQELARIREEKEQDLMEELKAVVQKVAKKKDFECVLLKGGFYVGGTDLTDDILKAWEKWGLTFWQRVRLFFTGKSGSVNGDEKR